MYGEQLFRVLIGSAAFTATRSSAWSRLAKRSRMAAIFARLQKSCSRWRRAVKNKLLHELTQEFPSNDTFAAEYAKAMGLPVPAVITR